MKSGKGYTKNLLLAATIVSLSTTMIIQTPVKAETLAEAIANATTPSYTLSGDYTFSNNAGALEGSGRTFTIDGQNLYSISGADTYSGLQVLSGQTLTLKDISSLKNFTTAVDNAGTLNVEGVTFTSNTTDVNNTATLNLSGSNTINTITGATGNTNINGGATWIKGGSVTQNTINLKGGDLVLALSTSLPLTPGTITANIVGDGTVEKTGIILNSGTINGTISGIFKGNNNTALANYGTVGNITADFVNNTATVLSSNAKGGAIYNEGGTLGTISGNFTGNSATSSSGNAYGGAIYQSDGTLTISNSTFGGSETGQGNSATSSASGKYGYGGAIYLTNATATITDSIFEKNSAMWGGAIYQNSGSLTLNNATFKNNTGNIGSSIYQKSGTLSITGSTFDNTNSGNLWQESGNLSITGSNFTNTDVTSRLGSNVTITGSTFDNSPVHFLGKGNETSASYQNTFSIVNSTIQNVTASHSNAYALSVCGGDVTIDGVNIINNTNARGIKSEAAAQSAGDYTHYSKLNIIAQTADVNITGNKEGVHVIGWNNDDHYHTTLSLYAKNHDILISGNTDRGLSYYDQYGSLTLNADTGHNITINDSVSSNVGMTVNSDNNAGTVALNGALTLGGDGLTLSGGTLKLNSTAANSIAESNLKLNGGKFDIANNAIDNLTFTNAINNAVNSYIALDVSLADTNTADKITSDISGASTVYVSDINFISDNKNGGEVQIADGNIKSVITVSDVAGGYADAQYNSTTGVLSFADKIDWLQQTNGNQSGYRFTKTNNGIMPVNYTSGENNYTFYTDILRKNYVDNNSVSHDLKYTWNEANHALSVTNSDDTAVAQTTMARTGAGTDVNPYVYTGDYTGNSTALGFERGDRISSITGDFISNSNGAINVEMRMNINNITGDFIGNTGGSAVSYSGDGSWSSRINSITGDFIGNYNNSTGWNTSGAAIFINNWCKGGIDAITGDFIGNKANGSGGAIWLADSTIGSLIGNFVNNYAGDVGGALYVGDGTNGANITVTGDFIANQAVNKGGAIYSSRGARIRLNDASFIGNIAPEGAAIHNNYNYATVTVSAQNKDIEFTNNNSTGLAGGDGYGIYNIGTLTLNAREGRTLTVNDKVYSTNTILINDYYTDWNQNHWERQDGTVIFNNDFTQTGATGISTNDASAGGGTVVFNGATTLGSLDVSGTATLKLGAGAGTSTFGAVTFSNNPMFDIANGSAQTLNVASIKNNAKLNIDLDFTGDSVLADAINITTGGKTGVLTINDINAITSDTGVIREFTNLAILTGETDGVTLALSDAIQADERFKGEPVETLSWESDYSDNATFANTVFTNTEYLQTKQKQLSVVDGTKLSIVEVETVPKQATGNVTTQDVLQALNQSTNASRSLTTDSATAVYTAAVDLGATGAGSLSVTGSTSGENTSTLNMNGKSGFELSNDNTTLVLSNLNITGVKDVDGGLLNITGDNSSATLTSVTVDSTTNSAIVNDKILNLAGNTIINTGIKGSGTMNVNGNVALNGALTLGSALNVNGGTLKLNNTAANSITNTNLKLNGGTFDIANGTIEDLTFSNAIDNAANSNLVIDASLGDTNTADKITSDISGASTIYVSDINFISDNKNGGEVQIADGNIKSLIAVSDVAGGYADVQYNNTTGNLTFTDKIDWLQQTNGSTSGYRFTKTNNSIMPVNYTSGENNYTFYTDILKKNYVDDSSVAHDLKYTWNNTTHQLAVTNSDDTPLVQTTMGRTGSGTTDNPYAYTGDYIANNKAMGFTRWDKVSSVNGDFVGNTDSGIGVGMGITIGDITGNFIGNSSNNGGAIYTHGDGSWGSSVANVTGDFIGNRATDGSGGAINGGGNYGKNSFVTITGDFIGNSATKDGGAIDRAGRNIKGNFINNKAGIKGGAIYANGGNRIEGDFINNTATSDGGAIYASNRIGTIEGDFVNNTSGGSGGAFYGCSDIIGNFTNNTAQTNGGAIYAISSISITGDITGNSAGEAGGAIYQSTAYGSTINDSKFENNTAQTKGGAIYADIEYGSYSDSTKINNTRFINNSATGENSMGGAIYATRGGLYITDTSFTGNSASKGAAIYSANTKTRIYAKTQDIEFTNNNSTGLANGTGTGIEIEGSTFTLNADENRSIVINDAVNSTGAISINADSSNTGSVTFNGDLTQAGALTVNKGTATFNGTTNQTGGTTTINNATAVFNGETILGDVTLNSQYTTLKFGANAGNSTLGNVQFYYTGTQTFDIQNDSVGTLNVSSLAGNSKAKFNIDIDFTGASVVADAINITTGGQTSNLMLNSINNITDATHPAGYFSNLEILKGTTEGVTLVISTDLHDAYWGEETETETRTVNTYTDNATFGQFVDDKFTDTVYAHKTQDQLYLDDTKTKLSFENVETVPEYVKSQSSQDVLQALNQSTNASRSLTTDSATAVYTAAVDLGATGAGSLSVTGSTSGENTSTLNMNGKSGFELSNDNTTLVLSNLNITGVKDVDGGLLNITGDNSSATLTSVTVDSTTNSAIVNDKILNLAGNTTINTGIKGSGTTNINGTVELNGPLALNGTTNISGGTLKLGSAAATSGLSSVAFTNTPTLDLQNTTIDTLNVDKITGNSNLNIDVNYASSLADTIQIATTGSSGTITVDSLNFLGGSVPTSFNVDVLTQGTEGDISGITLAISDALAAQYNDPTPTSEDYIKSYTYESNINFDKTDFTSEKWTRTTQKQLTVVDNITSKGLNLNVNEISNEHKADGAEDTHYDALLVLNQHEGSRTLTADGATANTYTVGDNLGTTATGTLNVTGKSSGSNLDMNNKTGFVVSNADTTLNLSNINITNVSDTADGGLVTVSGTGSKANLENVTIASTTNSAISNAVELNLSGTNNLGTGIVGSDGTTNITGGKTTVDSIAQNVVNITAGELEVANITATNGISNDGTLTLTGTANGNNISGVGTTVIKNNLNNTGTINQAVEIANTGTLTSNADKLGGTITNSGNLLLSGTLDKPIAGASGITKLNDNMTFADGAGVAGTLNFNGKAITMSGDDATSTFNIGKINSDGTINIDVNTSGSPVSDVINITTAGSTGTITINSINEIGARGDDFTLNVLQGTTGSLQLALSDAVHSQFDQAAQDNLYYVSDAYDATIDFDKTSFDTVEWDRVTQKAISIEDNTKIKYSTNVISDTPTGNVTQKDALAFINQNTDTSAVADRSMVTSDTNKTYTVQEDLGTTGAGTLLVQGASDKTTKLDMNNHSGFVVANSGTTVTLKDINVDNVQNTEGGLVNITNTGSSATLDGAVVNVKDNPENKANVISSNGTLGVTNSTVNAGVNNNGTMNLNGTNQIASVEGSNGTANVQAGTTTVGSIFQKLINIVTGGKLASNGDVTATNGITNDTANGLSVANGTLTGNVTGSGSTDFKGTSAIADGSTVGQAITVVDGKLTTLADGLGGAVTNGGEVDLTGGTLETSITGGNTTISGNVGVDDTLGSIASAVKVETDAKLTTNASNVTGAINNGGDLDLTGGDIKNTISGDGTTTISGTVTNSTGSTIGNAVTVAATGDLTTAADKLGGAVANGGTVQLDGGTLGQTITGGNISIIDDVDTNASNLAGATTVASSKELTLTGGDVNSNISGAGDTKITGSVNNNANISTATEVAGGALDNTNGQLADVTVTSGSLKSNANNVGAVANNGTYEITGGTIASGNGISGTGNINITGNVINNATNTTTGAVTVGAGNELKIGATGDVFGTASSVTMGDNSTLNLQNGSAVATNINNVVVGADDTLNLALDWGDQVNTTNPSNIAGNLQISSVDLTGTDGSKQTYQITTTDGIKDKISIKDPLDIQGTGVSNFVKYNDRPASANYGQLTTYQNSLFMAVTDTEVGEIATYNMITDETAGGGELDGTLKVQGNGHSITTGGVVIGSTTIQNAELTLEDANMRNITGDAITVYGGNKGHIVANAHDVAITANTGNAIKLIANGTNYAEMDIDAGSKTVTIDNDIVSDDSNNKVTFKGGTINFKGKFDQAMGVVGGATVNRGGDDDGIDWTVTSGTLNYLQDSYLNRATNTMNLNGGTLNTVNGVVTDFALGGFTLSNDSNFYADVDLAAGKMDNFLSTPTTYTGGTLHVAGLNLISDATTDNTSIPFANSTLAGHVDYTGAQGLTALSPIYKYNVDYNSSNGNFDFARYNSGGYDGLNPAIMAAPVAAQMGGYLTQLNSYDEAFRNMDMYMLMTAQQRQALKNKNKIASLDGGILYDQTLMRQERAEGWFRPFATFEKVPLKNGPKVENIAYGTYMGGESEMYDLGHGWDGIWGAYVGYNGSHQNYDGVSIYQNGGTLGVLGMAYKGNFFTGLTINAGASGVEASTMYGNEDFAMLMAGIASKTGYNWELFNGKFIIQPSMLMSYSFVNTFDYKNAAGVNIDSDPLHAIQLQPEIKFIGNLKNGWQPYASVAMVWNIMDDTKFKANDVSLPELSVKPYVKYGVGVRKTWGERLTGFFQTYLTNGGRNGVGLQAGFTWAFGGGKDKKADEKKIQKSLNKTPELKKTEIVLNGKKVQ